MFLVSAWHILQVVCRVVRDLAIKSKHLRIGPRGMPEHSASVLPDQPPSFYLTKLSKNTAVLGTENTAEENTSHSHLCPA